MYNHIKYKILYNQMGIPSYFSYIVKNYPEIIKKYMQTNLNVDNLYLDCNSIVYDAYYKLLSDKQEFNDESYELSKILIKNVCIKIEYYINLIKPLKRVLIAFDGVAPVAKLEQQRSRRYKSAYQNNIMNEIHQKNTLEIKDSWNTAAITPGTQFMNLLNECIKEYFSNASLFNVETIINSTSDIYGEGEHKIFEYMREFKTDHENETTIIYGLDADLIMLSINHLPICKNIYLFRETPHFIQSIDKNLDPLENYLLDIPLLTESILLYMFNDNKSDNKSDNKNDNKDDNKNDNKKEIITNNKIYDYIFLSFFLGNDFLPHFPSINIRTGGMDKLLLAYRETISSKEYLTDGKTIKWKNVRKLIVWLQEKEEDYLKDEYKLRNKREKFHYDTDTPENIFKKFEALPTYEREMEKFINPFKDYWQSRYYKVLFDIRSDVTGSKRKDICLNYMEGLEWTMKYYTIGCPDWKWCYKYNYPPLLQDLINYIPVFDTTFINNINLNPVLPLVQLCYVLPFLSLHFLPTNIKDKLLEHHPEWYKNDCEFVWCFCRYFWESHVKMNTIDLDELESFIKSVL
jgi:5'-3' exonuclease